MCGGGSPPPIIMPPPPPPPPPAPPPPPPPVLEQSAPVKPVANTAASANDISQGTARYKSTGVNNTNSGTQTGLGISM